LAAVHAPDLPGDERAVVRGQEVNDPGDVVGPSHEFETFEQLTKLLGRSALVDREQRELLASMHLKHGFLQSAAREWMAVCESKPDARALLGLARVAQANGQLKDAAVFAGEVLKADPTSAGAREILAHA
jgi:hypothetical protein